MVRPPDVPEREALADMVRPPGVPEREAEPEPPAPPPEPEVPPPAPQTREELAAHDTAEHRPFDTAEEPEIEWEDPRPAPTAVRDRPPAPRRRPAPPAPAKRRRAPAPPGPRGSRAGWWGRRVAGVVAIGLIAAVLYAINATFQPFHGDGEGAVRVTIPAGADAGQIGDLLAAHGVVDSGTFFQLNATLTGRRGKLRPGRYTLRRGMTNGDAIAALMTGPKAKVVKSFKVTITEGPSRREMAPLIDRSAVEGDYLKASSSNSALRRARRLGAPRSAKTAEGFLFPATYDLIEGATAGELVDQQLDAFAEGFRKVDMRYAKRKNLTRYDVVIIASMVEREAQLPRERPLVAAVIYNRLKRGMPLGIDATIRYYTNNWKRPIRQSELDADEPYNTRLNRGLPPTPIGNPGLAALKAAAHPANKRYLYFVRKPGKSGEHAFSSTDAQFERDRDRYQASREGK